MNVNEKRSKVIWRFSDDRAGHDSQSVGLVSALVDRIECNSHDVHVPFPVSSYGWGLLKNVPYTAHLPNPDLLIGAGHGTHFPILLSRYVRGGRALVLMKPSSPASFFDLCFIPEHDNVKNANNIIATTGPLNMQQPSNRLSRGHGLILIGGQSKHFEWDEKNLLEQILQILRKEKIDWTVTDSPRTPLSTKNLLQSIDKSNLKYLPFNEGSGTLKDLMQDASVVWVSEDSMSMTYEALSTGAGVGILRVPHRNDSRLTKVAQSLAAKQLLTLFDDWLSGKALTPPQTILSESARCADMLINRFDWAKKSPL